jgi:hypothetical protein
LEITARAFVELQGDFLPGCTPLFFSVVNLKKRYVFHEREVKSCEMRHDLLHAFTVFMSKSFLAFILYNWFLGALLAGMVTLRRIRNFTMIVKMPVFWDITGWKVKLSL